MRTARLCTSPIVGAVLLTAVVTALLMLSLTLSLSPTVSHIGHHELLAAHAEQQQRQVAALSEQKPAAQSTRLVELPPGVDNLDFLADIKEAAERLHADVSSQKSLMDKVWQLLNEHSGRLFQLEKVGNALRKVTDGEAANIEDLAHALRGVRSVSDAAGHGDTAVDADQYDDTVVMYTDDDPQGEPANTDIQTFMLLLRDHLIGKLSHEAFMEKLGADTSRVGQSLQEYLDATRQKDQSEDDLNAMLLGAQDDEASQGGDDDDGSTSDDLPQIMSAINVGVRCLQRNPSHAAPRLQLCEYKDLMQFFELSSTGSIRDGFAGMCLSATDAQVHGGMKPAKHTPDANIKLSNIPGHAVVFRNCEKSEALQKWTFEQSGPMKLFGHLKNVGTGMCLTLEDPTAEGIDSQVVLDKCRPSCTQLWYPSRNKTNVRIAQEKAAPLLSNLKPDEIRHPAASSNNAPGQRIVCWVMTSPKNHWTKALMINETWGQHCDLLLYMTTVHAPGLNTVVLPLGETERRRFLWRKALLAWMHLFKHYGDSYDWFFRADDDTFVNMDNLREYLGGLNPRDFHLLGRRLNVEGADFLSGGGGTIMSKHALDILGNAFMNNITSFANWDTFADDLELAVSLFKLGHSPNDTRDENGRERFLTLGLSDERSVRRSLFPEYWYWNYAYYRPKEGAECCSKRWVASHYTPAEWMPVYQELHELKCEAAGSDPWDVAQLPV